MTELTAIDIPLAVDREAMEALPEDVRTFIAEKVGTRFAALRGFGWTDIEWVRTKGGDRAVRVCAYGSPARDLYFAWLFVPARSAYEMHVAPYDEVLKPRWGPILVAERWEDVMRSIRTCTVEELHQAVCALSTTEEP